MISHINAWFFNGKFLPSGSVSTERAMMDEITALKTENDNLKKVSADQKEAVGDLLMTMFAEVNEVNAAKAIKTLTQTIDQLRKKVAYDGNRIVVLEAKLAAATLIRGYEPVEEGMITYDGCDEAIMGVSDDNRVVYSYDKLVEVFVGRGADHEEAVEWIDYNITGAYLGK